MLNETFSVIFKHLQMFFFLVSMVKDDIFQSSTLMQGYKRIFQIIFIPFRMGFLDDKVFVCPRDWKKASWKAASESL